MGYVELPLEPPRQGGKLTGTIVLDSDELRVTVGLLKDALAELTKGMANGVTPHTAAPQPGPHWAPAAAAATPQITAGLGQPPPL
jgi:hypothetical protein